VATNRSPRPTTMPTAEPDWYPDSGEVITDAQKSARREALREAWRRAMAGEAPPPEARRQIEPEPARVEAPAELAVVYEEGE